MFDDLSDLTDSPASYLAVLALLALDAVFPVAPSETVLVTGGILIERGDLIAPLFILAATCGGCYRRLDPVRPRQPGRTGPAREAVLDTLLGIAGGSLFEEGWGAFAVSIGVALAISVAAEAIYRFRRRSPRSP